MNNEQNLNNAETQALNIPVVMWRWFAYTHDGDFPFEEHSFTDFNEMKSFSARHSAIYKTETNKYRSGYERINAT